MKISVIIPTFNRINTTTQAVDSVVGQTVVPEEIIVVDDGSTDETSQHIRNHYPDVQLITQENQGVSAARNAGIRKAKGEWIALLDSDDEWLPQKLELQIEVVEKDPSALLVHTNEKWIRNRKFVNQMKKHQKRGGYIYEHCLPLCCISPSSVLIKKELFDQVGYFDESLPACEDYDLWLRICSKYPVSYLDEPLIIKYGGHEDQLSRKYWGMDRFRIRSLVKILESGELNDEQRQNTAIVLCSKLRVYALGAIKRSKHDEVKSLRETHSRWIETAVQCEEVPEQLRWPE